MPLDLKKEHDALLADLDVSIKKALDAHMYDLAGALYRLQGSARGWCEMEDCGNCPLAPHMCVSNIEERVKELADAHHRAKEKGTIADLPETTPLATGTKKTPVKKTVSETKARTIQPEFPNRAQLYKRAVLDQMTVPLKELEKKPVKPPTRWQRVKNIFRKPAPTFR